MTWIELLLLAVTLSVDTFAVSAGGSASMRKTSALAVVKVASVFAVVQGGFTLLGWLGGMSLYGIVSMYDHWIAFVLLAYIGIKMVADGISDIRNGDGCCASVNLLSQKTLWLSAVATSIDAMAVGVTLAIAVKESIKLVGGVVLIAVVTGIVAVIGMLFGRSMGERFGSKAQIVGGLVLFCIGAKILLEHTLL